jgi:outer membrane protein
MKNSLSVILTAAAIAAPGAALAQRAPAAAVIVVNSNRAANECNACRTALAQLRSQGASFETRRQSLSASLAAERVTIQKAIDALGGKEPDAALAARAKAFETKAANADQELTRTQQNLQSINLNVLRQIKEKLDPAIRTVMAAKGANLVAEAETSLAFASGLDATNDVIAQLNSTLTTLSVTPLPPQASPAGR